MKGFGLQLKVFSGCILLLCALVVTASAAPMADCPGNCTHRAAIGTTHYDTLPDAVTAANPGDTVTLLADTSAIVPITIQKPLVLDLGGKTVTGYLTDPRQAVVCFAADGTIRGGKIVAAEGSALLISEGSVTVEKDTVLESAGTVSTVYITAEKDKQAQLQLSGTVLHKGTASACEVRSEEGSCQLQILKDASITSEESTAITFHSAGKLSVEDGTVDAKKDTVSVTFAKNRDTELTVSGGKLLSREGNVVALTPEEGAQLPTDYITGGTYETLPASGIPAYARILNNADGTYTVISAYTLTFLANGGSGTMEPVKVRCDSAATFPTCGFTPPTGMDFAGWEAGGIVYAPADVLTLEADMTLKALWKAHVHSGGEATCLAQAICEVCGQRYGNLGVHRLSYSGGYPATCEDTGMNAHSTCSLCGSCFVDGVMISSGSLTIPALGHDWEAVKEILPTCTEDGQKAYRKCKTCAALHSDGKPVTEAELLLPAEGHTTVAVEATQATCTETGLQAHARCTACELLFVNGKEVSPEQLTTALSSHVLSDWVSDAYYHWKLCVDCDTVFRQNIHQDANADGSCEDCGYLISGEEDTSGEETGFSPLLLIPIVAAVAISVGVAIPLALKKRK